MDAYCDNPTSSPQCDTVYFSKTALLMANFTGSIVTVSSFIMIIVIYRSAFGLSTVYHRIMMGVFTTELVGSLAKSFGTIPMPTDQMYPFHGSTLGTLRTCEIQGFFTVLGKTAPSMYFCGLCVFYLCLIQLRINDRKIRRFVEPMIHLFGFFLPMTMCVSLFSSRTFCVFALFSSSVSFSDNLS